MFNLDFSSKIVLVTGASRGHAVSARALPSTLQLLVPLYAVLPHHRQVPMPSLPIWMVRVLALS